MPFFSKTLKSVWKCVLAPEVLYTIRILTRILSGASERGTPFKKSSQGASRHER